VDRVNVRLLYFEDCPSWRQANEHLDSLRSEYSDLTIQLELVDTPEKAIETNFRGSPSIMVDDQDLFGADTAEVGLSCRIYQTPTGLAGCPTLDQIRTALEDRLDRS
jgi:hypothetical protein